MEGQNTGEILGRGLEDRPGLSGQFLCSGVLMGRLNGSSGLFTHRSCVLSKKLRIKCPQMDIFRGPSVLKSPRPQGL